MNAAMIAGVLARDLRALHREIESYASDADVWKTLPGIQNCAGTLALHLAGNLQHFVGAVLGGDGYVRDRDAEFNSRNVPRAEILRQIDRALGVVEGVLPSLPAPKLLEAYPAAPGGLTLSTGDFLLHLATHLAYHLGQLDYHRRVATGGPAIAGMLSPGELSSAKKG